jgi:hypothetical protein
MSSGIMPRDILLNVTAPSTIFVAKEFQAFCYQDIVGQK